MWGGKKVRLTRTACSKKLKGGPSVKKESIVCVKKRNRWQKGRASPEGPRENDRVLNENPEMAKAGRKRRRVSKKKASQSEVRPFHKVKGDKNKTSQLPGNPRGKGTE